MLTGKDVTPMTKAKSKTKKIILLVIAALAAAALIGVGLYLFLPGSWRSLDSFSQYDGLLDAPLTEITISRGMEEITFSDQDLLRQWEEGLGQLQLKKEEVVWYKIFPVAVSGTQNHITLRTETGEYTLVTTYSLPDPKVYLSVFRYGVNDPDCLPIESTFAQAAQRQGESSYFSSGTWLRLRAVSGYRAMFSAPWTAVTVSDGAGETVSSSEDALSAWRDYLDQLLVQELWDASAQSQIPDGTRYELTVQTQEGSYSLSLRQIGAGEYWLETAEATYAVRSDGECPLEGMGG